MIKGIQFLFEDQDPVAFSEDQEEKRIAGVSYEAVVALRDGFSESYKPNEDSHFDFGKSITLFG